MSYSGMLAYMRARFPQAIFVVLVLVGFVQGCATSRWMVKASSLRLRPAANESLVVFMRPSSEASATKFTLIGGRGHYLGDSLPESYHTVRLRPGPIAIYTSAKNDVALKGTLVGGRVYYVLVQPISGMMTVSVNLIPIRPGTSRWGDKAVWLYESKPYRVNLKAGQGALSGAQLGRIVKNGEAAWQSYDAREQIAHTLWPEDGEIVTPEPLPSSLMIAAAIP